MGKDQGLSRRGFLATLGVGAVAVASVGRAAAEEPGRQVDADEQVPVRLSVDGRAVQVSVEPRWSLLFVLRELLGLTAAKPGCERGECGACTVLVDGLPRYACLTLAVEVEGAEVTTLAGLMDGEELGPVQRAFAEEDALQCGYCTPGQILAAEGLLRATPDPTPEEVRIGMSGNLCRCGAYPNIARAVARAGAERRGDDGQAS